VSALYKIVVADDHTMVRHGLRRCLDKHSDLCVVGEARDGQELLSLLRDLTPDLVILDISMPIISGLEAAREITRRHPGVKILVLTMHKSREYLHQALAAGVHGYLLKENALTDLLSAIETIRRGENYISPLMAKEYPVFEFL
jgi:DNA-binding NarL/FixJ family response regulator